MPLDHTSFCQHPPLGIFHIFQRRRSGLVALQGSRMVPLSWWLLPNEATTVPSRSDFDFESGFCIGEAFWAKLRKKQSQAWKKQRLVRLKNAEQQMVFGCFWGSYFENGFWGSQQMDIAGKGWLLSKDRVSDRWKQTNLYLNVCACRLELQ